MLSFGYIDAIWWFEVVSCHDVVDIVDSSWSHSDFGEVRGPDTSISIFSLILRKVGWIYVIMDISISFIPFLIVILFEMMMSWMNCKVFANPRCQLELFIDFIQQ